MSTKDFRFARDVAHQKRRKKIKAAVVVGLAAMGAWGSALVVAATPLAQAPKHLGEPEG